MKINKYSKKSILKNNPIHIGEFSIPIDYIEAAKKTWPWFDENNPFHVNEAANIVKEDWQEINSQVMKNVVKNSLFPIHLIPKNKSIEGYWVEYARHELLLLTNWYPYLCKISHDLPALLDLLQFVPDLFEFGINLMGVKI